MDIKDITDIKDTIGHIKDNQLSFIKSKCERIAFATYLISSILSDHEPIKWELRRHATSLLSDMSYRDFYRTSIGHIDAILVLLRLAAASHVISEMNHNVLMSECIKVKGLVIERDEKIYSALGTADMSRKQTQQRVSLTATKSSALAVSVPSASIDSAVRHGNTAATAVSADEEMLEEIRERMRKVLESLKPGVSYSMAEIQAFFPEWHIKSLQRTLHHLALNGAVLKRGRKRWSTYRLNA